MFVRISATVVGDVERGIAGEGLWNEDVQGRWHQGELPELGQRHPREFEAGSWLATAGSPLASRRAVTMK